MLLLNLFMLKLKCCYVCVPDMEKDVVIKIRLFSLVLNIDAEKVYNSTQHKSSDTENSVWRHGAVQWNCIISELVMWSKQGFEQGLGKEDPGRPPVCSFYSSTILKS